MLAPRNKLWSTPAAAVDIALRFADLGIDDIVYDVGCGDGRVLIQMAALSVPLPQHTSAHSDSTPHLDMPHPRQHHCRQFLGIEISPERAAEARRNVLRAQQAGSIPSHVAIDIVCANALDTGAVDYAKSTVVFLYLVPRGLRLIKNVVWPEGAGRDNSGDSSTVPRSSPPSREETPTMPPTSTVVTGIGTQHRARRIITYMAPFENTPYIRKECCQVPHQIGAAWPVYLYRI